MADTRKTDNPPGLTWKWERCTDNPRHDIECPCRYWQADTPSLAGETRLEPPSQGSARPDG